MKKLSLFFIALCTLVGGLQSCQFVGSSQRMANRGDSIAFDDYDDDSLFNAIVFETLSDKNQWLRVDSSELNTIQLKRLADGYNASVIQNSIITDIDLQMRGYLVDEVVEAIKKIDVTVVKEPEIQYHLKEYKDEMLFLITADSSEVDTSTQSPWIMKYQLYAYLSKKYYVTTFGDIDEDEYWAIYDNCPSVPEWSDLIAKRGNKNMVNELREKYENATDFDARCIYAVELAHAYEADLDAWRDDEYINPAAPIMESLMKEKKYSLYLKEVWQTWRVLYQSSEGASKDSEIPNLLYNDYRNICCCTILSYIKEHPEDIKAVNEFLVITSKENILREGDFRYGNQAAMEKYYIFPEKYTKGGE